MWRRTVSAARPLQLKRPRGPCLHHCNVPVVKVRPASE
jgi:hypothetical protein